MLCEFLKPLSCNDSYLKATPIFKKHTENGLVILFDKKENVHFYIFKNDLVNFIH